jgi:hypothetical protein
MWPNLLNMFKGKAGGAQMTPYKDLKAEELEAWEGYDPASEKSRHTQYANAAAQQQPQQSTMFGQLGDPGKAMGTVWDQLKGAGGKFKEGIQGLDRRMEENYAASGWAPEGYKSPYDKSEDTPEYTPGGSKTLGDIKSKEDAVAQAKWQKSPEGEEFLENMRSGQRVGDYAVGNATMGGPFGGILNSLFSKPWSYDVKPRHKYGSLE